MRSGRILRHTIVISLGTDIRQPGKRPNGHQAQQCLCVCGRATSPSLAHIVVYSAQPLLIAALSADPVLVAVLG
jgi:hypothetical protein